MEHHAKFGTFVRHFTVISLSHPTNTWFNRYTVRTIQEAKLSLG